MIDFFSAAERHCLMRDFAHFVTPSTKSMWTSMVDSFEDKQKQTAKEKKEERDELRLMVAGRTGKEKEKENSLSDDKSVAKRDREEEEWSCTPLGVDPRPRSPPALQKQSRKRTSELPKRATSKRARVVVGYQKDEDREELEKEERKQSGKSEEEHAFSTVAAVYHATGDAEAVGAMPREEMLQEEEDAEIKSLEAAPDGEEADAKRKAKR